MKIGKAVKIFEHVLSGYTGFWCVAGGWAIDLYLNRQTREHADLEVVILREDFQKIYQQVRSYNPQKIIRGNPPEFVPWKGDQIEEDVIQLRLDPIDGADFDLLLTPSEGDEWICRRDEVIRRKLPDVACMTASGLPVLAPEIVLLFKAKYLRDKDLRDYTSVIDHLTPQARQWLNKSLTRIHPGHIWIDVKTI